MEKKSYNELFSVRILTYTVSEMMDRNLAHSGFMQMTIALSFYPLHMFSRILLILFIFVMCAFFPAFMAP